jgi:hypothetical protein
MSKYSKLYRSMGCCGQCGRPSKLFYCGLHNNARNNRERRRRRKQRRAERARREQSAYLAAE